ncbi:hypothetical protein ATO6_12175 [Oceanicola sp. 22II-s10i]|uniref:NAD-dependent epimerase/dehydratase family protein n=1 Tax=Oceanicola sp. 22II-s10i TaxID=1317116 RepID=UPI000B5263B1|nr:NAD-dependent epimerase/dehydratase family protein [Oceanicola sp. 22II-s10i]OWU84450.1 hypothetical protein ATO6_12175 [Oceanicola sp. 22II-s10i]
MSPRWLVTGGAGFIGGHLVRRLADLDVQITVLDDFSTGSRSNLPRNSQVRLITGDVADPITLGRAMEGASGVFHCAATVSVQRCITDWSEAHRVNAFGTVQVFDAARRHGRLPVVYASSAAVYGDRSGEACHEDLAERPLSPYGADKLLCEHQARAFWQIHRLPSAGLRLFNVYGPGQRADSPYSGVIARFLRNVEEGRPHVIFGDGKQSRDFIHVDDIVTAMTAAMVRLNDRPDALLSNVCTGRSVSLLQLAALVDKLAGRPVRKTDFQAARHGDIRHSAGDTSRMRELLGLTRMTRLEDGLLHYYSASPALERIGQV